jgi:metallo-beta-lactamase family protein
VQLTDTLKVRFNDAGHILGSSILEIWLKENRRESKLVFTGDLGNKGLPILRDPTIIREADYLIIESTYGNKIHKPKQDNVEKFINIIYETMQKGGNIIIPSFAVGRTQEVIYELNKHVGKYSHVIEQVLHIPVFVDSPLAISATEVFRNNLDCYDEEAREYIENGDNPLDFPGLTFTKTAEESIALNTRPGSAVIISASGMCEAGRIKHHLKHNLWRKECSVVFVGYQAPGTLGRKIADGAKMVRIFGEEIEVDARVEVLEGFSGHADRDGLLEWIRNFEQLPKKLFIVHGEEESMLEFAGHIKSEFPCEVIIPSLGETYKLEGIRAVREAGRYRKGDFKRLEIISILENLKEEFDEVSSILKEDLSLDLGENELDSLKSRLMNIEESLIKAISR